MFKRSALVLSVLTFVACTGDGDTDDTAIIGTDVDTETGSEVDTETEEDTEVDTEQDTEADTDPLPDPATTNHSLSFDGVDDFVAALTPVDFEAPDVATIEAWIRPGNDDVFNSEGFVTREESFSLFYDNQSSGNFVVWEDSRGCSHVPGDGGVNVDEWHHVAGVWDSIGERQLLYINGQLVDEANCDRVMGSNLNSIVVGAEMNAGTLREAFSGLVDEVRIWNVERTQSEIQSAMTTPLTGAEDGLLVYLPFEEGSGSTTVNYVDPEGTVATLGMASSGDDSEPTWSDNNPF